MRKFGALVLLTGLLFGSLSCLKDRDEPCRNASVESERDAIVAYAAAQGMTVTAHSSGLYYEIVTQGTGATPTLTSKVSVTYTGKLVSGATFDSGSSPAGGWTLGSLIAGWQIAIPLIQKGGHIKMIVPSSLAYGCRGAGTIPGNSILFFDVQLTDVQ